MENNAIQQLMELFLAHPSVSIDSRTIQENDIFFCLKGPNFNAHHFIPEIVEKGASAIVIDEEVNGSFPIPLISVANVELALQQLANAYRKTLSAKIFALTGSNGKTTHKELLLSVCSKKWKCQATKGNLNNHLGVPLTLLSIKKETEFAIIEMGANHMGEIEQLAKIAEPDFGFITNIGKAHIGEFGSQENIIHGKLELAEAIQSSNGTFFLNTQDKHLLQHTFSKVERNLVKEIPFPDLKMKVTDGKFIQINLSGPILETNIHSQLSGKFQAENLMSIVSICLHLGIDIDTIKSGIEEYAPSDRRVQWTSLKNWEICNDAYNANPSSMQASIEAFEQYKSDGIMVLGEMFELGEFSEQEHKAIVEQVNNHPSDVIYVGKAFLAVQQFAEKGDFFSSTELLSERLKSRNLFTNYKFLLLKGSRSMRLESILEII